MSATQSHYKSISVILDKCLSVSRDDELLVIFDESLQPFSDALWRVFVDKDISATCVFVPKHFQHHLAHKILSQPSIAWLPKSLSIAIHASTAIINVLDGELGTSPVRRAVIQHQRTRECRLAHIPGISREILSILAESNFEQIEEACELVAWVLGNGRKAKLTSYDYQGTSYTLELDLGGWDNEPMMSPGIIRPGSWGNVPPGETFCCPTPETVNGDICINGSVPGIVLRTGEDVLLTFERGRLTTWRAVTASPACAFFDRQATLSRERDDHAWNTFSELGVGLNAAVKSLTGNSLFDEKALGTVHIAIGDNTTFGRNVKASIHADLATVGPDLIVDDTSVMTRGEIDTLGIQRGRADWSAPASMLHADLTIRLKEADLQEENGYLRRRLYSAGRLGLVKMHNEDVSTALLVLYKLLRTADGMNLAYLLSEHPEIRGFATERLLDTLYHYRCVAAL